MSNEQEKDPKEKLKELQQNTFKQQSLPALWPEQDPEKFAKKNAKFLCLFGAFFLVFGIILTSSSSGVVDAMVRYDEKCDSTLNANTPYACKNIELVVAKDMKKPVYFYYHLANYFQNHRRYVKSRDPTQQRGYYRPVNKVAASCDPIVKIKDLFPYQQKDLNGNTFTNLEDVAIPCGLIAKSLFNDKFKMTKSDGKAVTINEKNIAWQSDIAYKYKNIDSKLAEIPDKKTYMDVQWTNMEDEHFIVWMRQAGLPSFKKLWGIIDEDLAAGTYKLEIDNKYIVKPFQGQKSVVVSTTSGIGGNQSTMGILYIVISIGCFLFAIVFLINASKYKRQN